MPVAAGRSAAAACIWTLLEVWSAVAAIVMATPSAEASVVGEVTAGNSDIMAGLMWASGLVK